MASPLLQIGAAAAVGLRRDGAPKARPVGGGPARARARAGGSGNLGPGKGQVGGQGSTYGRSAGPCLQVAGKLAGGGRAQCHYRRVRGAARPSNRDVARRRCRRPRAPCARARARAFFLRVNRRSPAACRVLGRPPLLLSLSAIVPNGTEPKRLWCCSFTTSN
jgi:hypothetical protein